MLRSSTVLMLVMLVAATAAAGIMPLESGFRWHYVGPGGDSWHVVNIGAATYSGAGCVEQQHVMSGGAWPQEFRQYWSADAEGRMYYHGAVNVGSGLVIAPSPAVLEFDVPLVPGKSWTTVSDIGPRSEEFKFVVEGQETVTVPAGTFETTRIAAHVDGRLAYHHYVADGVGMVKRGVYVLESYGHDPAQGENATLSAVKGLFR